MARQIPYAVANLEEIREENYFFVDKTRFIEELERYKVPVFLRPRRFGKTLWCSILECYYDINKADAFDSLFGGLHIGRHPTQLKNQFLVLRLNFSEVEVKPELDRLEENFNDVINVSIDYFLSYYESYFKGDIPFSRNNSASFHLQCIHKTISKKKIPSLYIIIDEYDNFTNQLITSHQDKLYYDLTTPGHKGDSFFRSFFKVIKTGVESRAIDKVFITGVLPITIDDLTSGFNIAEIVTMKKNLHNMLGFTQAEVDDYVGAVFNSYGFPRQDIPGIIDLLKVYYNGYVFIPGAGEQLYNSTILTYFLKSFVIDKGEIPRQMIDTNLRTDLSWIRRLTEKREQTLQLVEALMIEGGLVYDENELGEKFNMVRFFEPDFYSTSLFYLGMLSRKDKFHMVFPNQSVKQIFAGYYYDLLKISGVDKYVAYFEQFLKDGDLKKVFTGYWETYIAQIPAQAFDKMNENFFRISFFELCSRYLNDRFTFAIEVNYPSGRCDWEMRGRRNSGFDDRKYMLEFKYFSNTEVDRQKIISMQEVRKKEIQQIQGYAGDSRAQFPGYEVVMAVIYIAGNKGFRFFRV